LFMGKACGHGLSSRAFPGFIHLVSLAFVFTVLTGASAPFAGRIHAGAGTNVSHYYSSAFALIGLASTTGGIVYLGFDFNESTSIRVVREWGTVEPSGNYSATGLAVERVLRPWVSAGLGFSLADADAFFTFRRLPVADVYGRLVIVKLPRSSLDLLVGLRTVYAWNFSEIGIGPRLAVTANGIL